MRTWKYGVSFAEHTPLTAPLPLEGDLYENMKKARAYGYDAVEFHTRETYVFDYDRICSMRAGGEGDVRILVTGRLCTEGGYSLLDAEESSVCYAIEHLKMYVDKASVLGADIVLGWIKGKVPAGADRDATMAVLAQRLRQINDYGKEKGVKILLEVINRYETNIFNTAKETLDFFHQYRLDNCYVHLDTFHMNIEEADMCAAIRLCGHRLGYLHVADNTRTYPGSGALDFKAILKALEDIHYTGFVTVECLPQPDREAAAKKAIEHLVACEPN